MHSQSSADPEPPAHQTSRPVEPACCVLCMFGSKSDTRCRLLLVVRVQAEEEEARRQRLREKLATPKEMQFTARIGGEQRLADATFRYDDVKRRVAAL